MCDFCCKWYKGNKYSFDLLLFFCRKCIKIGIKEHYDGKPTKVWKVKKKFKIDRKDRMNYAKEILIKP